MTASSQPSKQKSPYKGAGRFAPKRKKGGY
jgi:hypothetical protein